MTSQKKESQVFLDFFKQNKWMLLTPTILLGVMVFIYQLNQPPKFYQSVYLEMEYDEKNINQRIILTDAVVTHLRTAQVQDYLKQQNILDNQTKVIIYKNGTLSIITEVENNQSFQKLEWQRFNQYLNQKGYPLNQVGEAISFNKKNSEIIYGLFGFFLGFLIGLFVSLIRAYFKNY